MKFIKKLLIANRGEIVVRIIKTCQEMGIETVAVFSDADQQSLFVKQADEAIYIGASPSNESYLNQDKIIEAAQKTGADAIHPGYGFLSENAEFAQHCLDAGLVFIGPSPKTMSTMSSKIEARQLVSSLNLPIISGYDDPTASIETFREAADRIGYPILLKASAGGGGIGMRIVTTSDELEVSIESAKQESLNAFGDDRLFIEKYLTSVRHIEFQIIGDQQGHIIHCYERECSIQRRHQKIIEETPSPLLTPELREKIGEAAIAIAKAIHYTGVGTVEFVVEAHSDEDKTELPFYFLEMNTRLQVEHGITEMVTGLDLVKLQIQIAEGQPLKLQQSDLHLHGYAIESRLYAEDPENNFHPVSGRLLKWEAPSSPSIRIDTGLESGMDISVYYDPLLAKMMVWAESRKEAIRLMHHLLSNTVVLGLTTNQSFLKRVFNVPAFIEGKMDTHFIDTHFPQKFSLSQYENATFLTVSTIWIYLQKNQTGPSHEWKGGFQLPHSETFLIGEDSHEVSYFIRQKNQFELTIGTQTLHALVIELSEESNFAQGGILQIQIEGRIQTFHIAQVENQIYIHSPLLGNALISLQTRSQTEPSLSNNENHYYSQMPARILKILISIGDTVEKGQKLLTMESMKMESNISANSDGQVTQIHVIEDQLVESGIMLLEVDIP